MSVIDEDSPDMAQIELPHEFDDDMKRIITLLMDKAFTQVNTSVEEMTQKYPHLNNSVARFNMGQTLMLGIMMEFKHEIDQQMVYFISKATQEFVETAQTVQIKKDKITPPEYIR